MDNKLLWAAVIKRAIDDLRSPKYTIKSSARGWLNDTTSKGPGSFYWICKHLDLDRCYIKKAINGHKKVKKGFALPPKRSKVILKAKKPQSPKPKERKMKSNEMTLSQMVAVYNEVTGNNINKFRDKKTAINRFEKAGIVPVNVLIEETPEGAFHASIYGVQPVAVKGCPLGRGKTMEAAEKDLYNRTKMESKVHLHILSTEVRFLERKEEMVEVEEKVQEVEVPNTETSEKSTSVTKRNVSSKNNFWNHRTGCQADIMDIEIKKLLDAGEKTIFVKTIMEKTGLKSARVLNHLRHLQRHKDHMMDFTIKTLKEGN